MSARAIIIVALVGAAASPAGAVERGDTCTLKAVLPFTVNQRGAGRIETVLDVGTEVTVVAVGDEGRLRVTTGDATGSVATRDFEAACAGTLQSCSLTSAVVLYARTRSDSQSWRLKEGATLSVLRAGSVWAHVRIDDLEGYVKAPELKAACKTSSGSVADTAEPAITEEVLRGDGPGVLFLTPLLEGAAPVGDVDLAAAHFFERLAIYRPDAATLPLNGSRTATTWKSHMEASAARARGAGFAYVLVSKGSIEAQPNGSAVLAISMVLIDAKTGAALKGVRVRPTSAVDDLWAEQALATLLPFVAGAPGSRVPLTRLEGTGPKELAPRESAKKQVDQRVATAIPDVAPWFANPWGYVALGAAVAAGAGSGIVGNFALQENDAANATSPLDPLRGERRERALQLGVTGDALAGVAVVSAVTSLIVFAARAGMDDRPAILAAGQ